MFLSIKIIYFHALGSTGTLGAPDGPTPIQLLFSKSTLISYPGRNLSTSTVYAFPGQLIPPQAQDLAINIELGKSKDSNKIKGTQEEAAAGPS